jgi:chorismate mutase
MPRLIPAAIAMVKLVLADAASHQKLIESKTLNLNDLRETIDKLDEDILLALARRQKLSQTIGQLKQQKKLPIQDKQREQELFKLLKKKADNFGLNQNAIDKIWQIIIAESKKQQ